MSQAFQQVKALLGKLDRSIDEARGRRLGSDPLPATADREPTVQARSALDERTLGFDTVIGRSEDTEPSTKPAQDPSLAVPVAGDRRQSAYGRAKPLRPAPAAAWRPIA